MWLTVHTAELLYLLTRGVFRTKMKKRKLYNYDPDWKEEMLWRLKTPNAKLKYLINQIDEIERKMMINQIISNGSAQSSATIHSKKNSRRVSRQK